MATLYLKGGFVYNIDVCKYAIEAERDHATSVIAMDSNPERDTTYKKLPYCECPECNPALWPDDIQKQLDEFYENNGPGTVSVDF